MQSQFEFIPHPTSREQCAALADQLKQALSPLLPPVRFTAMQAQIDAWDTLLEPQRLDLCRAIGWRALMFLQRDWVLTHINIPEESQSPQAFVAWAKNHAQPARKSLDPLDDAGRQAAIAEADKILTLDLSGPTLQGYWVHKDAVQWVPQPGTIDANVISHSARFLIHRYLAQAYDLTGDTRYLSMFHTLMADVVWEFPGNVMQRWFTTRTHWGIDALDVAIRTRHVIACAACLAGPREVPSDIMLLLWRMLYWSGVRGQEFYHLKNHNIAFYEAGEQGRLGFYFPGFKEAQAWRELAQKRMAGSLAGSVMTDGSNAEASTNYHFQYLNGPIALADASRDSGIPLLPEYQALYQEFAGRMLDSWARQTTPNRALHPQGDGWHHLIGPSLQQWGEQVNAKLSLAVASPDPAQWPRQTSHFLPVQRYAAMRSSWAPDALWAGFSLRGFHEGHDHRDLFHVELQSGSRRLLLDSGVIDYQVNRERSRATKAHNTLVVDGQDHLPGGAVDIRWYSHPGIDFCEGAAPIHPDILHRRAVCFIHPGIVVILDRITFLNPAPKALPFSFYYHLPLDAQVQLTPTSLQTSSPAADQTQPNLRLDFVAPPGWSLHQEQGFIAVGYLKEAPGPVAVLSGATDKPFTIATIARAGQTFDPGAFEHLPVTLANAGPGEVLPPSQAIGLSISQPTGKTTLIWSQLGLGRKTAGPSASPWSTDGDLLLATPTGPLARRASYVHHAGAPLPFTPLRDMSEL